MKRESPVEKFSGYVILPEFMTRLQVRAFEDALGDLRGLQGDENGIVMVSVISENRLPAILACVKEWHLVNIPAQPDIDNFPMTPIHEVENLTKWLFEEIYKVWIGETEEESPLE